jgi:hypothetical protein
LKSIKVVFIFLKPNKNSRRYDHASSQELYQQVNHLPSLEKLRLAELLLADLDTPNPEIDGIWNKEAKKGWRAYKLGELKTVSYEEVMQKYK